MSNVEAVPSSSQTSAVFIEGHLIHLVFQSSASVFLVAVMIMSAAVHSVLLMKC
jgi:hypothetical protein